MRGVFVFPPSEGGLFENACYSVWGEGEVLHAPPVLGIQHYLQFPIERQPPTLVGGVEALDAWRVLGCYAPASLVEAVISGFRFGRSIRYEGPRKGMFVMANYSMTEIEMAFERERTAKDIQKGLLTVMGTMDDPLPFSAGALQPRFVDGVEKLRIIVNPIAVNPGIKSRSRPVRYSSFADAERALHVSGRNTIFIKFDIESAYNVVPIASFDLPLGLERDSLGSVLLKRTQQWGVVSAGYNWLEPASLLCLILFCHLLVLCIFYVDDYILTVPGLLEGPDWNRVSVVLHRLVWLLRALGLRTKKWGIFSRGEFLGLGLDSVSMCIYLPVEKKTASILLILSVASAPSTSSIRLRKFASLVGVLNWAASACWVIRPLLKFMYNVMTIRLKTTGGDWRALVRVGAATKARLRLIGDLLETVKPGRCTREAVKAFSDACNYRGGFVVVDYGFAGFDFSKEVLLRASGVERVSIPILECFAMVVVVDTVLSSPYLREIAVREGLCIGIDSQSVVYAVLAGSSGSPVLNNLIYYLFSQCNAGGVRCELVFVRSNCNPADSISRFPQDRVLIHGSWLGPVIPSVAGARSTVLQ